VAEIFSQLNVQKKHSNYVYIDQIVPVPLIVMLKLTLKGLAGILLTQKKKKNIKKI